MSSRPQHLHVADSPKRRTWHWPEWAGTGALAVVFVAFLAASLLASSAILHRLNVDSAQIASLRAQVASLTAPAPERDLTPTDFQCPFVVADILPDGSWDVMDTAHLVLTHYSADGVPETAAMGLVTVDEAGQCAKGGGR